MHALVAQQGNHAVGRQVVRHPDDGPHEPFERRSHAVDHVLVDEILHAQRTDDLVRRPAINRDATEGTGGHHTHQIRPRCVHRQHCQFGQRHHQVAGGTQAQPQRPSQPLVFVGLQQATVAALHNQEFDLVGRVDVTMGRGFDAKEPKDPRCRAVEQADKRPEGRQRPAHRQDGGQRHLRGELQRQRFGNQLAEHDLCRRKDHKNADCGRGHRRLGIESKPVGQMRGEPDRHRGLGICAEDQARKGDANLRDRDIPIELGRLVDEGHQAAGKPIAVLTQPLHPAAPDADRAELGGHVQGVNQDQDEDDRPDGQGHADLVYLEGVALRGSLSVW